MTMGFRREFALVESRLDPFPLVGNGRVARIPALYVMGPALWKAAAQLLAPLIQKPKRTGSGNRKMSHAVIDRAACLPPAQPGSRRRLADVCGWPGDLHLT